MHSIGVVYQFSLEKNGDERFGYTLISEDPKIYVDKDGKSYIQDTIIVEHVLDFAHEAPASACNSGLREYFKPGDKVFVLSNQDLYLYKAIGTIDTFLEHPGSFFNALKFKDGCVVKYHKIRREKRGHLIQEEPYNSMISDITYISNSDEDLNRSL